MSSSLLGNSNQISETSVLNGLQSTYKLRGDFKTLGDGSLTARDSTKTGKLKDAAMYTRRLSTAANINMQGLRTKPIETKVGNLPQSLPQSQMNVLRPGEGSYMKLNPAVQPTNKGGVQQDWNKQLNTRQRAMSTVIPSSEIRLLFPEKVPSSTKVVPQYNTLGGVSTSLSGNSITLSGNPTTLSGSTVALKSSNGSSTKKLITSVPVRSIVNIPNSQIVTSAELVQYNDAMSSNSSATNNNNNKKIGSTLSTIRLLQNSGQFKLKQFNSNNVDNTQKDMIEKSTSLSHAPLSGSYTHRGSILAATSATYTHQHSQSNDRTKHSVIIGSKSCNTRVQPDNIESMKGSQPNSTVTHPYYGSNNSTISRMCFPLSNKMKVFASSSILPTTCENKNNVLSSNEIGKLTSSKIAPSLFLDSQKAFMLQEGISALIQLVQKCNPLAQKYLEMLKPYNDSINGDINDKMATLDSYSVNDSQFTTTEKSSISNEVCKEKEKIPCTEKDKVSRSIIELLTNSSSAEEMFILSEMLSFFNMTHPAVNSIVSSISPVMLDRLAKHGGISQDVPITQKTLPSLVKPLTKTESQQTTFPGAQPSFNITNYEQPKPQSVEPSLIKTTVEKKNSILEESVKPTVPVFQKKEVSDNYSNDNVDPANKSGDQGLTYLYSLQIETCTSKGLSIRCVDVNEIHKDPTILMLNEFLTPDECDKLIQYHRPSCNTPNFDISKGHIIRTLQKRLEAILKTDRDDIDNIKILSCQSNAEPIKLNVVPNNCGIFMFLNAPMNGGEIIFDKYNVNIKPELGEALVWMNTTGEDFSCHVSVPDSTMYFLTCTVKKCLNINFKNIPKINAEAGCSSAPNSTKEVDIVSQADFVKKTSSNFENERQTKLQTVQEEDEESNAKLTDKSILA